MEDVRAVAVHLDPLDPLGIDIPGDMRAAVDHEHAFARVGRFARENGAEEPRADDEIIVAIIHR